MLDAGPVPAELSGRQASWTSAFGKTRAAADRRHFELLDALRGIAALIVVLYHLGRWRGIAGLATNGYLGVDFFFCLSGFVVAMAYGAQRAPELRFMQFSLMRLKRLMPLIVLANVVAVAYVTLRLVVKPQHDVSGTLTTALLLGAVSMPYFHAPAWIGGPQVFPLNGPQYTLFLEIAANLLWFVFRERIGLRASLLIASICYACVWVFGIGGDTTADFLSGFPRVTASFYAGVAVFHIRDRCPALISPRMASIAFVGLSGILLATLLDPWPFSTGLSITWIMVLSPTIVLCGSFCRVPPRIAGPSMVLGELSYPVYTMHYPIFCWINGVLQTVSPRFVAFDIAACTCVILVGSWYALVAFDRPARRWLTYRPNGSRHTS